MAVTRAVTFDLYCPVGRCFLFTRTLLNVVCIKSCLKVRDNRNPAVDCVNATAYLMPTVFGDFYDNLLVPIF